MNEGDQGGGEEKRLLRRASMEKAAIDACGILSFPIDW